MAARFNRQGNLAGFFPEIHPSLEYKPHVRVEGACGSGGLGLMTAMKTVLADVADVVLTIGVEVQNTVKAIYGADILAGAGHYAGERKNGHAYFFPSKFDERAGACYEKFGKDYVRKAMALWYKQAVENVNFLFCFSQRRKGAKIKGYRVAEASLEYSEGDDPATARTL